MPPDGELQIVPCHARTIVGDPHECLAARRGDDIHLACSRINGVFDQLLDHAGRAFDHFSGGDLVDHALAELSDCHESPFGRFHTVPGSYIVRAEFASILF
ncbi:hypothetical protein GCM10009077_21210 [Roseibium denhamense]